MISNLTGILGRKFTFGTGDTESSIVIDENGTFILSGPLDLKDERVVSAFNAIEDTDIPNLGLINKIMDVLYENATTYTDQKISEMTGGTTGQNVMLLPMNVTVTDLKDGSKKIFGDLTTGKFIDRIILEVNEIFGLVSGDEYEFAIGTNTNPVEYMQYTRMTNLHIGGNFFDVGHTLLHTTNIVMTIRKYIPYVPPEPEEPFQQILSNPHSDVVTSSISADASGNVVTFTLTGTDVTGRIENQVVYAEVTGDYLDFSFNMDLIEGHEYRIVEHNGALIVMKDHDTHITIIDGNQYQREETIVAGSDTFYNILMDPSTSDSDYRHVYVYDPSSETPDSAILAFHIHNQISFVAPISKILQYPNRNETIMFSFDAISEATMLTETFEDNKLADVYLYGSILPQSTQKFPGIKCDHVVLDIKTPVLLKDHTYCVIIYSDALSELYGVSDTCECVLTNDVRHFFSREYVTVENDNTQAVISVPLIPKSDMQPYVVLLDTTNNLTDSVMTINIYPEFTFMQRPKHQLDIRAMTLYDPRRHRAVAEDSGKMSIRILSF